MGLEMIGSFRKEKGMTLEELSVESGVPVSTIKKISAGITTDPNLSTIQAIASALDCTLDDFSDTSQFGDAITTPERKMIKKYRTLDEHGKRIVDLVLNEEADRCTTKAIPVLVLEDERAAYNVIHIPLPDNRASAGFGEDLDSDNVSIIKAIANRDTIRTDFAVTVDGDSMEPLYHDGDIVLVHRQPAIDIGCVGVFAANDKGYIKKQGDDRLISLNPNYPDVAPEDCYEYKCFGEVIGVLNPKWIVR